MTIGLWSAANWCWLLLVFVGMYGNIHTFYIELGDGVNWFYHYNFVVLIPASIFVFVTTCLVNLLYDRLNLRNQPAR